MKPSGSRIASLGLFSALLAALPAAHAANLTWSSSTLGGNWTGTNLWTDSSNTSVSWSDNNTAVFNFTTAGQTIATNNGTFTTTGLVSNGNQTVSIGSAVSRGSIVAPTITLNNVGSFDMYAVLSGNNGLALSGNGTSGTGRLNLKSQSTYTGNTSLSNNAYLMMDSVSNALPSGTTVSMVAGTTMRLGANNITLEIAGLSGAGTVTGTGNNTVFTINTKTGASTAYSGSITSSTGMNLVIKGSGTQTLSGTGSTYNGTTTISGGTLIAGGNAPSAANGVFGNSATAITLGDANTTANNSSPSLLTGGAFTIGRAVTIANQATTGTYTIGGNANSTSTFSGLVTTSQNLTVSQVSGGTLNLTGGVTGAGSGAKVLTFGNAGAVNVNTTGISDGSGTVAVVKTGAGNVAFNVANTYTGNTTISAGTLVLGANGSFDNSPVINLGTAGSQGTLNLAAKSAFGFGATQTLAGYGTVNLGVNKTVTVDGILAPGNGAGIISVTGNVTLGAASTTKLELLGRNGGAPVAGTDFDKLVVSGLLSFGGALALDTTGLSGLADGDSFQLFTAGSYATGFSSVGMTGVYASAFNGASGVWTATNSGLLFTFTESSGLLAITAVPEPSAFAALAGLGALGLAASRRRRR